MFALFLAVVSSRPSNAHKTCQKFEKYVQGLIDAYEEMMDPEDPEENGNIDRKAEIAEIQSQVHAFLAQKKVKPASFKTIAKKIEKNGGLDNFIKDLCEGNSGICDDYGYPTPRVVGHGYRR